MRASTPAWPALNFWSMAGQPLQWQGPWIYSGDPSRLCSPSRQLANLLPSTAGPSHQHWNRETINAETMNNIFQESRSHQGAWHHTQACNPAFQSCHLLPPPPPPPAPAVSLAGVHRASISSRVLPCKRTQRCCQRRGGQPGRPGSLQLRLARLAAPQAHGRPRRGCTPGGALSPSALSPWHAAGKPAPARVIGTQTTNGTYLGFRNDGVDGNHRGHTDGGKSEVCGCTAGRGAHGRAARGLAQCFLKYLENGSAALPLEARKKQRGTEAVLARRPGHQRPKERPHAGGTHGPRTSLPKLLLYAGQQQRDQKVGAEVGEGRQRNGLAPAAAGGGRQPRE